MRKTVKRTAVVLGIMVLGLVGYLGALQASGNFHIVAPEQVYRAAQMDGQDLARWRREHGIASVLNLRGQNDGKDWYETERAVAERLNITHIDFRLSASEALTDAEVQELIQIMRDAPKPMLIHCRAGSDRTGIASALYVAAIAGGDEAAAEWQLSLAYGHIGLPWVSEAYPMDVTWERIEPWLGYPEE